MRWARPKAIEYSYSIAAVWGKDTPLLPEGQLVPPGRYTAVLTVDGKQQSREFDVLPDPRVTNADYSAAAHFSAGLYAPLAKAWTGEAEMEAVRQQLAARLPTMRDAALAAQARALSAKLEPSDVPNSGFSGESATLASLETAAEGSDAAPSTALRSTAAQTIMAIDADWDRWQRIKASDLAALNKALTAAGLAPITVPQGEALSPASSGGGEDLP